VGAVGLGDLRLGRPGEGSPNLKADGADLGESLGRELAGDVLLLLVASAL
jgi:hypothetical protein